MQSLQQKDVDVEFVVGCLSLINAIVNLPISLKERTQLRKEFLDQNILGILDVNKMQDPRC